ncbi:MAG: LPS export ABC transporter permease LptF [Mangrovicoccus sp.]|nr:LPS export ABC transporter permease LptF [Mangrovicoccus sp.]
MGRFDRYILGRLLLGFGFFALVLVGVYWINRAVVLLERYLSQGQGGQLVLEVTLLSLPSIIQLVTPIAAFIAVIYTTNRLYSDSELVVAQTAGFGAFRLARPYLVFGLIVAVMISILAHAIVPLSMVRFNDIRAKLAEAISSRLLEPGSFQEPTKGITVYVREVDADGRMRNVLIDDRRDPERFVTYTAQEAFLIQGQSGPQVLMFDGMAQSLNPQTNVLGTTLYQEVNVALDNMAGGPTIRLLDHRELPTHILFNPPEEVLYWSQRDRVWLATEGHIRFAQAALVIPTCILGLACLLSARFTRFGLWRQILMACVLMILLKLAENAAIDLGKRNGALWPVIYGPTALCTAITILLLHVSNRAMRRKTPKTLARTPGEAAS